MFVKAGYSMLSSRRSVILKWSLVVVVAAVALAIDLWTKHLAEQNLVLGETEKILPFLYLQRTANSGVAFGLLGGKTSLIIIANILALLVVGVYVFVERRAVLGGIAGGLVIGGSFGNLLQRFMGDGHVTDFLKFPHWPNFNAADVFIDVGIAVIVLGLVVEAVRVWRAGREGRGSAQKPTSES
ncbi:MAG: signal peptidase II [Actinobacteria bacterium]|nr:signal peptidase II [Actinomycetota bacterium]